MEKFCGTVPLTRETIFNTMNSFSFTISEHNNIMSTDSKLINSFILKKSINFMSAIKSFLSISLFTNIMSTDSKLINSFIYNYLYIL